MFINKEKVNLILEEVPPTVAKITIEYSGSGDSGSTEYPSYTNKDGKSLKLNNNDLDTKLENIVYDILEDNHSGWEIEDGASGSVIIDMENRSIKILHDTYYTESEHSEEEVNL